MNNTILVPNDFYNLDKFGLSHEQETYIKTNYPEQSFRVQLNPLQNELPLCHPVTEQFFRFYSKIQLVLEAPPDFCLEHYLPNMSYRIEGLYNFHNIKSTGTQFQVDRRQIKSFISCCLNHEEENTMYRLFPYDNVNECYIEHFRSAHHEYLLVMVNENKTQFPMAKIKFSSDYTHIVQSEIITHPENKHIMRIYNAANANTFMINQCCMLKEDPMKQYKNKDFIDDYDGYTFISQPSGRYIYKKFETDQLTIITDLFQSEMRLYRSLFYFFFDDYASSLKELWPFIYSITFLNT